MRPSAFPLLATLAASLALVGCPASEGDVPVLVCDADQDGALGPWCGGDDCDDTDAAVSEGCGEADGDDDSTADDDEVYTETVACEDWSTPVSFQYVVDPMSGAQLSLWYEYSEVFRECWIEQGNASAPAYYHVSEVEVGEDGHLRDTSCGPSWVPTCFPDGAVDPVLTFASITLVVAY